MQSQNLSDVGVCCTTIIFELIFVVELCGGTFVVSEWGEKRGTLKIRGK
jgi:hypothetical protein